MLLIEGFPTGRSVALINRLRVDFMSRIIFSF